MFTGFTISIPIMIKFWRWFPINTHVDTILFALVFQIIRTYTHEYASFEYIYADLDQINTMWIWKFNDQQRKKNVQKNYYKLLNPAVRLIFAGAHCVPVPNEMHAFLYMFFFVCFGWNIYHSQFTISMYVLFSMTWTRKECKSVYVNVMHIWSIRTRIPYIRAIKEYRKQKSENI